MRQCVRPKVDPPPLFVLVVLRLPLLSVRLFVLVLLAALVEDDADDIGRVVPAVLRWMVTKAVWGLSVRVARVTMQVGQKRVVDDSSRLLSSPSAPSPLVATMPQHGSVTRPSGG